MGSTTVIENSLQVTGQRSLALAVAERLADRVHEVGPYRKLGTKADLRRETGVAAATLNEALRMLESQGLITTKTGPTGGVFTSEPHPFVRIGQAMVRVHDGGLRVHEAVTVRSALEPLTVEDAARHRTAEDLEIMRERLRVVEESVDEELGFAHAIWDFHRAIYQAGANEILKSVCLGLIEIVSQHATDVLAKTRGEKEVRVAAHRALLEAIEAQDLEACARASEEHWLSEHGPDA